jgi:cell division protein FtsB
MNHNLHKFSAKKLMNSTFGLIASFLVFGIVVYSLVSIIPKQKRAQEAKVEAQEELEEHMENKDSLEQEIGLLTSNFGREKALREKFGVVIEGEEIVVLVDDDEEIAVDEKRGVWSWFKKLFGGR